MKVKELPDDTKLENVKVRIPEITSGLATREVYVVSGWHCGVWVKTDLAEDRVYPVTGIHYSDVLEWEVV